MRSLATHTDDLLAHVEDDVAVDTLNRPERRNALSRALLDALADVLREVEADDEVGCVVLTGAGGAFSAGGDVKDMAAGSDELPFGALVERQRRNHHETAGRLHRMPKPTIAALPGPAAGAGLSLALACDLRYAADGAVLTTAFARVGLAGDYGGSWFLTQLVGPARARELYFFSDRLSAAEAKTLGLVNDVFAADTLQAEVLRRARRLADGPRLALRAMKDNLNRALTGTLEEALDLEATFHLHTATTDDHREAATAFVEKREPVFRGH
jgi:2-(1,2-epoxy-1,2-dihydrophenyl)acetyl-CoA isomerase